MHKKKAIEVHNLKIDATFAQYKNKRIVKYKIANSILLGVVADRVLSPTNALAEARKFVALF